MKTKKLFEQAIADAKSIRDSALANAKATLEENLTPKLQRMLAKKLQEQEEREMNENEELDENANELDEDLDLDEILAELELEEGGDSTPQLNESQDLDLEEGEDSEKKDSKPVDSKPSTPKADSKPSEPKSDSSSDTSGFGEEEVVSDEDKVNSLTVGDLKDVLRGLIASELAASGGGGELGEPGLDDMSLDSPDSSLDPGMDDVDGLGGPEVGGQPGMAGYDDEEDIDLEELLAELEGLKPVKEDKPLDEASKLRQENAKLKADLEEAKKAVGVYRKELNEQNLLNAKLLYVNKIL
jgi:hypothetical protein